MLSRTRSVTTLTSEPNGVLTRALSVPDLTSHVRSSPRYKPQWPSSYSTRSYCDWNYGLGADYYFWDRSWYRLFHLDRHPIKWSYPYNQYRATFRSYLNDTTHPYFRFISPYFNYRYNYSLYRPYVYDFY